MLWEVCAAFDSIYLILSHVNIYVTELILGGESVVDGMP
jgi:hypothetical protein